MTATAPTETDPVVVVGVSEAATILVGMQRSNVANFLDRRITPYAVRPDGRGKLWRREDVERVKAEYDADEAKVAADNRRRASARGEPSPPRPAPEPREPRVVIGPRQRLAMELMVDGPLVPTEYVEADQLRTAIWRLAERGFVRVVEDSPRSYALTEEGREAWETLQRQSGVT